MTNGDFVKRVETELRDLNKREKKLLDQEDTLKKQRAELRARAAELNRSLAVYRQVMGMEPSEPEEAAMPTGEVTEGTIADVAFEVVHRVGGTMRTSDIATELVRLGKLTGKDSRVDYSTVYRSLMRDSRFMPAGKGEFSVVASSGPQPPSGRSLAVVED
jgi:hypothetical protein